MPRPSWILAGFTLAWLATATAGAQQPTVKPIATVKQVMRTMIVPFSDTVFSAVSEPPKTEKEWESLRGTAMALAESGNLLMLGWRARDQGEWIAMARREVEAAEAVMKAADAKDVAALEEKGDALYETCESCHLRYMNMSPPPDK